MKKGVYLLYTHLSATPQRGDGLLRMMGDHCEQHAVGDADAPPTELSPDSQQLPSKKPAKSMQDINLKAGPYFGMRVPPVAERING